MEIDVRLCRGRAAERDALRHRQRLRAGATGGHGHVAVGRLNRRSGGSGYRTLGVKLHVLAIDGSCELQDSGRGAGGVASDSRRQRLGVSSREFNVAAGRLDISGEGDVSLRRGDDAAGRGRDGSAVQHLDRLAGRRIERNALALDHRIRAIDLDALVVVDGRGGQLDGIRSLGRAEHGDAAAGVGGQIAGCGLHFLAAVDLDEVPGVEIGDLAGHVALHADVPAGVERGRPVLRLDFGVDIDVTLVSRERRRLLCVNGSVHDDVARRGVRVRGSRQLDVVVVGLDGCAILDRNCPVNRFDRHVAVVALGGHGAKLDVIGVLEGDGRRRALRRPEVVGGRRHCDVGGIVVEHKCGGDCVSAALAGIAIERQSGGGDRACGLVQFTVNHDVRTIGSVLRRNRIVDRHLGCRDCNVAACRLRLFGDCHSRVANINLNRFCGDASDVGIAAYSRILCGRARHFGDCRARSGNFADFQREIIVFHHQGVFRVRGDLCRGGHSSQAI